MYRFNFDFLSKSYQSSVILSVSCKSSSLVLFAEKLDLSDKSTKTFQLCVPKDSMDIKVHIENPTEFSRKVPDITLKYEKIQFEPVNTFCSVDKTYSIVAEYSKQHKSFITDTLQCMDPFTIQFDCKSANIKVSNIAVVKNSSITPMFKLSSHIEQYNDGLPPILQNTQSYISV